MIYYLHPARISLTALRGALYTQLLVGQHRHVAAMSDGEFRVWLSCRRECLHDYPERALGYE